MFGAFIYGSNNRPSLTYSLPMLANLAKIMVHPRPTMRRILDAGRDRLGLLIVILASYSAMFGDLEKSEMSALRRQQEIPFALIVIGLFVAVPLFGLLVYYLFSWVAYAIGRALEGTGKPAQVRSAAAWGLAPVVWALLYRLPASLFFAGSEAVKVWKHLSVDTGRFGSGCIAIVIFGALELTTLIWCITVSSNTIAEAHGFSSWRGLATFLLTAITPAILLIAGVLAAN